MRGRSATASLVASPILVGAVTILVTLVAVFLAYNANEGLPFVPTYDVKAIVPNAAGLVRANEVRIGGKRVGLVKTITAEQGPRRPVAVLKMSLDKTIKLRSDSKVTIRPRSTLGLKYLQIQPGAHGKYVEQGGTLPVTDAQPIVELDQVQNALDAPTRRALDIAVGDLGPGLAGRGIAVNQFVAQSPQLFKRLDDVMANLADPATGLDGFVKGLARAVGELSSVSPQLADATTNSNITAGALAGVKAQLGELLSQAPPTESAGIRALSVARPVLRDARLLVHDIAPGVRVLPTAAARLHSAIQRGLPVLRRTPEFADRTRDTLTALDTLARDPATPDALRRLLTALQTAGPILDFFAPGQLKCNYLGVYWRNIGSVISEGDPSGTWFRTLVVAQTDEAKAEAQPAPNLHDNPYPNTAAPGQTQECEAGNEPYLSGQRIGNVPGNQGLKTQDTSPPPGVGK
jgi:ABC-type transporter Mla subunit MlaD